MGHASKFVAIGKLGNDLLFVTIGNLGNDKPIAKIANGFCCEDALGGGEGTQPLVIGNIGNIVIMFQLA